MAMKMAKRIQWVVFTVVGILALLLPCLLMGSLIVALFGATVFTGLMGMIVGMAYGAVWGYGSVGVWVELAERGWFR